MGLQFENIFLDVRRLRRASYGQSEDASPTTKCTYHY